MLMVDSELSSESQSDTSRYMMRFTKMQALGNDFVVVSEDELNLVARACALDLNQNSLSVLARDICDRHFSVGADGLIVVRRSDFGDQRFAWSYINSDGSVSLMCGNGLRCMALWLKNNSWCQKNDFVIETGTAEVEVNFENARSITCDIAVPKFEAEAIPVRAASGETVVGKKVCIAGIEREITCVNVGNPHCVVFVESLIDEEALALTAAKFQNDEFFPEGVNVEFVKVVSPTKLDVLVWERGCGKTLACGSGAAAALIAAVKLGQAERSAVVALPGGELEVSWREHDNTVSLKGPAAVVFDGRIDLRALNPQRCQKEAAS